MPLGTPLGERGQPGRGGERKLHRAEVHHAGVHMQMRNDPMPVSDHQSIRGLVEGLLDRGLKGLVGRGLEDGGEQFVDLSVVAGVGRDRLALCRKQPCKAGCGHRSGCAHLSRLPSALINRASIRLGDSVLYNAPATLV